MKKIVIEAPQGVPPHYKLWAKEAAQEMISQFPEYKSSFQIEFDEKCLHGQKEIDDKAYQNLPNNDYKRKFIQLPSGKYLVPYASEDWYIAASSEENKKRGVQAVDMEKYAQLKARGMQHRHSNDLVVSLLKEKISPDFYGYGIEKLNAVLSLENCQDKELFITIFMHEFGHILNATHEHRAHTHADPNLGIHCTNDLCIMGESNYPELTKERLRRKKNNQPPFCDECIASMRETLEKMPELEKAIVVEHHHHLPVLPHNNDNWKSGWRNHYNAIAQRDNISYQEDNENPNFVAELVRQDGSKLKVEANNEYNVSLGAENAQGEDDIPSIKDFSDIVSKAAKDDALIEFANIQDDEFKARLLVACLEATPRMKTAKAPHIDNNFLENLQQETKQRLQKALSAGRNNNSNGRNNNHHSRYGQPPKPRGRSGRD